MTTPSAGEPLVPLWDDTRIEGVLMWVKYRGLTAGTREMLKTMRDEYEQQLAEAQAKAYRQGVIDGQQAIWDTGQY